MYILWKLPYFAELKIKHKKFLGNKTVLVRPNSLIHTYALSSIPLLLLFLSVYSIHLLTLSSNASIQQKVPPWTRTHEFFNRAHAQRIRKWNLSDDLLFSCLALLVAVRYRYSWRAHNHRQSRRRWEDPCSVSPACDPHWNKA